MADEHEGLAEAAATLAGEFGIDVDQLATALTRIEEWSQYFTRSPADELRLALSSSDPELVVAEFLREHVGAISVRAAWVPYLTSWLTPLYTRGELAQLLVELRAHLRRNREDLLATGHPASTFDASPWLDWHLVRLYYVHRPFVHDTRRSEFPDLATLFGDRDMTDRAGNTRPLYVWSHQRPRPPFYEVRGPLTGAADAGVQAPYLIANGRPVTELGVPVSGCAFEDAGLMQGFELDAAAWLESMRPKLLDLRQTIMRRLAGALRSERTEGLWEDCAQAVRDALPGEEARRLIECEGVYGKRTSLNTRFWSKRVPPFYENNGGLSELLSVVGHVEKEIEIGTMHETKCLVSGAAGALDISSYYAAIGEPWQRILDDTIATLFLRTAAEQDFWAEHGRRAAELLETELDAEVLISTRVPREHAAAVEKQLGGLAGVIAAQVASSGKLPPIAQITLAASCAQRGADRGRVQDVAPFPTPAGVGWEQVAIVFYNDETVRITAGDFSDHKTFEHMGFVNRRRMPPVPDQLWVFFRELAEQEGQLDGALVPQQHYEKTKRMVSDLRGRLKRYFSIEEDPFRPYRSCRCYHTRYVLRWDDGYRRRTQSP